MNKNVSYYDVAVIGGGLAGLSTAIQTAREGFSVVVFEKENYPFHKVCGEYISLESWDILRLLGIPLEELQLPVMDTLQLSSGNGKLLEQKLPLGGFGISRFYLDHALMRIAVQEGVTVLESTKVHDVQFSENIFTIKTDLDTIKAKACCGAFGKRSNLDVKWKRPFTRQKQSPLNNFIGVKYHVRYPHPKNVIALHNFSGGYCGVAAIEEEKINLCYLTTAQNLRDHSNDVRAMEQNALSGNPYLKKIFSAAEFLYEKPLTISQVSFEKKEQIYDHILLTGDAAGMITPLCGNGMSMALQAGTAAARLILRFLKNEISREAMEHAYVSEWRTLFSPRLQAGRIIQTAFNHQWITTGIITLLRPFPRIAGNIIRHTHG